MVMSSGGGYVTAGWEWPKVTPRDLYLTHHIASPNTQGGLSFAEPPPSNLSWVYDPANPTPSTGGFAFYDPGSDRDTSLSCGPTDTSWFGLRPR